MFKDARSVIEIQAVQDGHTCCSARVGSLDSEGGRPDKSADHAAKRAPNNCSGLPKAPGYLGGVRDPVHARVQEIMQKLGGRDW
eukprot:9122274-Pyramimonas_sp.AAC.1